MKKNNPILRTCMVCKNKGNKSDFIRIVRDENNEFSIDRSLKKNCRGCYLCNNIDCVQKFKKTRALNRVYKVNISEEIYDNLLQQIRSDK